jgi:hypothetical protein
MGQWLAPYLADPTQRHDITTYQRCLRASHKHKHINFSKVGELWHVQLSDREGVVLLASARDELLERLDGGEVLSNTQGANDDAESS